jgi:uncharacterized protein Yka (UPF0111/DUF47 family)
MVPLQKLLGKEDRFNELLEASAAQALESVRALRRFMAQQPGPESRLDEFVAPRRTDKAITAEINHLLCTSPVTALEREDIEALATSIYKIPKTAEKIAERVLLAPQHLAGIRLDTHLAGIEQAADTLLLMVRELRVGATVSKIRTLNEKLQAIEGEMDDALNEFVRGLYNATENPGRIVFLKDIFELLEKVTDRCRDAGNVVSQIVLKGS